MAFFLLFKSKCPAELRNIGPFYLTVIDAPANDVWYKNETMGASKHIKHNVEQNEKNVTISRIVRKQKMKNHSSRKKNGRKLKCSRFPKCEIKKHHRLQL